MRDLLSPCITWTACRSKELRRFWRSPKAEPIRRMLIIVRQHTRVQTSGNMVRKCGVEQAFAITFALSRGFENAFGKRSLEHCGTLLRPKARPGIVQRLLQK